MRRERVLPIAILIVFGNVGPAAVSAAGHATNLPAWQISASHLTTLRGGVVATATATDLYVAGGTPDGSGHGNVSTEFAPIGADGSLGSFVVGPNMEVARDGGGLVIVGHDIYIVGGANGYNHATNTVERAVIKSDGSLGAWTFMTAMKMVRVLPSAVAVGGYLYAIGGENKTWTVETSTVERARILADGSLGPWNEYDHLLLANCGMALVNTGSYVYLFGGGDVALKLTKNVERAQITSSGLGPWQASTNLEVPVVAPGAVIAGHTVYVLGGYASVRPGNPMHRVVQSALVKSDGTLGAWSRNTPLAQQTGYLAAAVSGQTIYAVAGNNGFGDTTMIQWTTF